MTGASTATLTFTAPATAAGLTFQLTVTDNQQATHVDSISVTVNSLAAPVLVRQPTNPHAVEHGSALVFVVASGENLNYEWRRNSFGNIIKTGPEPFLLRAGDLLHPGETCYYVVVSNSAGSVTSNPGCITVEDLTEDLDPSDEERGDRYAIAGGYGEALFGIAQQAAGILTGAGSPGITTAINRFSESAHSCLGGGSYLGTTLDGQALANNALLPVGQHVVSMSWNSCIEEVEGSRIVNGGILVSYNFPNEFGVGSFTMHLSGFGWLNGTLEVTQSRGVNGSGRPVDDVDITITDNFSIGGFRKTSAIDNTIEVERRLNASATIIEEAVVDFDLTLSVYDASGFVGSVSQNTGGNMHLIFDPVPGDNNIPSHRSSSTFGAGIGNLPGGGSIGTITLLPSHGSEGWGFNVEYPPDPDDP